MADTTATNVRINLSLSRAEYERLLDMRWRVKERFVTRLIRQAIKEYLERNESRRGR